MVKDINDLTISDQDLVERTGRISHLKKWYNPFPAKYFEKKIVKLLNEVVGLFSEDSNDRMEDKEWEMTSMITINRIKLNYYGVVNILRDQARANIFKRALSNSLKRKLKEKNSGNLNLYIGNLKELTGIEVKKPGDLKHVLKDLEFKQDKYIENHSGKGSDSSKPTPFMVTVIKIFLYLGIPFNGDMRLTQYAIYQEMALAKFAKEKHG